ncbi:MAG: D-alanyl-D-alanine carboxypeptidase family protein [Hyphomicrobium aestuarii]|nr:D-alanyl-D-alanine carboxypeptidase family protein [Hyphomicrobium aestuarii]
MRNRISASKRHALRAATLSAIAVALAAITTNPVHAGPALVFEVETSRILHADNPDTAWYPASLTKLMTAYMVFDALKRESLTGRAEFIVSPHANAQPKMRVGLGAGKLITVNEALAGLIIHSANDLAVALAEAVSGSEDEFVADMNEMAVKLGMVRTRFANANGLPKDGQVTTARDMAILARALLRDFPQWNYLYAEESAQVGRKTVTTHNEVLRNFDGADGMKTGFTCGAGYNLVASATRDGRRIIAVVLGETSGRARTTRAQDLLEKAFAAPRAAADSALIDPAPLNGEMLVDMPLIVTPGRAANFIKVRNCWPEPSVGAVTVADGANGSAEAVAAQPSDPGSTSRVAEVVPPAPPVRPQTPPAPSAEKAKGDITSTKRKADAKIKTDGVKTDGNKPAVAKAKADGPKPKADASKPENR